MSKENIVVALPVDGIIDTEWARKELMKAEAFSTFDLCANRGRIFFMLKSNLSAQGYEQSVADLDYTVPTSELYISFLEKLPVLEAIRAKYFVAVSLSASEFIPDDIEEAMALIDITIARIGKVTAESLKKALEISGKVTKSLSDAAITVERLKKKALEDWLLEEHGMSQDDIHQAQHIKTEGKGEFLAKMLQAYSLLDEWPEFYKIIAEPIHASGNTKALRFLADINDASKSILDYLASEKSNRDLIVLKQIFESEVYPLMSFEAEKK